MDLFGILTGPVRRMSYVHRYSSFPVHNRENVAEHSWWVAFISYLVGNDIAHRTSGVGDGPQPEIDFGLLLSRAIVHDLDECLSGDIIRSFKYRSGEMKAAVANAANENMIELTGKMHPVGRDLLFDWRSSKDDLEGSIVAFADMVAVVIYCREEYILGNRDAMPVLKEMYETWFHRYHHNALFKEYANRMFPNRRYTDAFAHAAPFPRDMTLAGKPINAFGEGAISEHDFGGDIKEAPLS